jgi:serine/threonine protein kinase
MKSLDHTNIANFNETYEDEENLYLVMEYLDDKNTL